ncbi:MAG: peptidoglycan DD-metalloendopeptidase family protein [Thermoanaerobaculia bacterium]|nr:peptidoglycan DD-metalloendopeptidase family protein [Thermoanaerobaculia bacterium]
MKAKTILPRTRHNRTKRRIGRSSLGLIPISIVGITLLTLIYPVIGKGQANRWAAPPEIDYSLLNEPGEPLGAHTFLHRVGEGDTLESILLKGGCDRHDAFLLSRELSKAVDPRRLRIGELFRFSYGSNAEIEKVSIRIKGWGEVVGVRSEDGFAVESRPAAETSEEVVVDGMIDTTLYDTLVDGGESPLMIDRLYDVFQWDIDFFRLRRGDGFRAIIEKRYRGSDFVGYGPVIAAHFEHDGTRYEGFYNETADGIGGYYTRDGRPVKKQFLKAPLRFPRVTSGFAQKRFHPVLKTYRPHLAIDYGAPTGTPVMTTADGVVTFAGRERGEGNYVRVRHTRELETWYLHLSRFAEGIRKGSKVEQGQIIGYVGATGLATGPHLDYRVKQRGAFINPKTLRSITPDPLGRTELVSFLDRVRVLAARLDQPHETPSEESTLIASRLGR